MRSLLFCLFLSSAVSFHTALLIPSRTRYQLTVQPTCNPLPLAPLFSISDDINSPPEDGPVHPPLPRYRRVLSRIIPFPKDDEAPLKEKLLKLGLAAFLSYGFVSNMTYAVMLSLAYFVFTSRTGITPLAPGQKAPFLAVYTTFFVINNFLRPVRLAVATYTASYFEGTIKFLQERLKLNRVFATVLVVFLFNICGTFAAMFVGVNIAAWASGVPPQLGLLFGRA